jgi:hypothetical protein
MKKASERRAVAYALTRVRCPSCNRAGWIALVNRKGNALCHSCGLFGTVTAVFERRPTRAGFRVVATSVQVNPL